MLGGGGGSVEEEEGVGAGAKWCRPSLLSIGRDATSSPPPLQSPPQQRAIEVRTETFVEFQNVTIRYASNPSHTVLNNLTWRVNAGEHWLVEGANGSGKTTLLELISGENPLAYQQNIRLFGVQKGTRGQTLWDVKRRIGQVSAWLHMAYVDFAEDGAPGGHAHRGVSGGFRTSERSRVTAWEVVLSVGCGLEGEW